MLTGKNINLVRQELNSGNLVAIPTETVYGLAGNAYDEKAVLKIFEAKNRPSFDPLIVHTHRVEAIDGFAFLSDKARKLFEAFSPGALTILLEKKKIIPDLVSSGLPRVAVRIPNHPLTLELLRTLDFPLAAPSANPFGYISPTTAAHVAAQLGDKIAYILDGGPCTVGVESTIVGFEGDETVVYRLGGLALEELEKQVGALRLQLNQSSNPHAPGMLKSHYAPRKPLFLGDVANLISQHQSSGKLGVLSFQHDYSGYPQVLVQERLSPRGDIKEAAQQLFAAMRALDASEATIILAEKMPEQGLGLAMNDRLSRAAVGAKKA